jgi:hypothetical protein
LVERERPPLAVELKYAQVIVADLVMVAVCALVVGMLADWIATPRVANLGLFAVGQLALTWSAWRLRGMGTERSTGLPAMALKLAVAMSALVVPLFALTMFVEVGDLGSRNSPLHDTVFEPVAMIAVLAVCSIYPLVLLAHVLRPLPSRWHDEDQVVSVSRTIAIAVDVHLVLCTAWIQAFGISEHRDIAVDVLVLLALYGTIALPRFAVLASRFHKVAFASACFFVFSSVLQSTW